MASLESKWDETGKHYYENGVDHGVLYVKKDSPSAGATSGEALYEEGVAWNGLTNVSLSPEGGEPNDIYADNIKYLSIMSVETLKGSIEAFQSPKEFDVCDGTEELSSTVPGVTIGQQDRKQFALCFRTKIGSDTSPEVGYKIHIVYGCLASPSERAYETINDSPDAMTLSWDFTTTPVKVGASTDKFKPTALVTIDTSKLNATKLQAITDKLYGTGTTGAEGETQPTLLMPNEIITILNQQ